MDMDKLRHAAEVLKGGGLVAFPTETVYGLGADALNETAVRGIFEAKGRPSDNPLIVHISDKNDVDCLVKEIPSEAGLLMDEFWPGPLTLVMYKSPAVPSIISAGLDTVAIRMPSHPVAAALIRESGLPIAAPSANTSGRPSPTIVRHVIEDLSGRVDIIIDAGPANVGLESTVLDVTVTPPLILRPGGITREQLEGVIHGVGIDPALSARHSGNLKPKSPGMKYRHYSPKAEMILIVGGLQDVVGKIRNLAVDYRDKGRTVGILATEQTKEYYRDFKVISSGDRQRPETIASNLFRYLREFDSMGVDLILAEGIESVGIGLAVMNRMSKAAGYNIIKA